MLLALALLLLFAFLVFMLSSMFLFDFFMLSIYLFLSFMRFLLLFLLSLRNITILFIVLIMMYLLILDFDAYIFVEIFVSLYQVRYLAEHVRLDLQLHEFLSKVFHCVVISHFMSLFLEFFLETLWLVRIVKDNFKAHPCSFDRNHCL